LHNHIENFFGTIGLKASPVGEKSYRVFWPLQVETYAKSQEEVQAAYDRARKDGDELNELARALSTTYDEFVRLGRRKLGV
jgi:hypothetical protein